MLGVGRLRGADWTLTGEDIAALLRTRSNAAGATIRLEGGELLSAAALPAWIAACQASGGGQIEITTSAVPLARPGLAAKVQRLGVDAIVVPLYGADADAHDWIAGHDGLMKRTLAGIRNALAAGLGVTVVAPILRPTYRELDRLVGRALGLGVRHVEVVYLPPSSTLPARLGAHPALAAPVVIRSLALVAAARREATVFGLPPCLLGTFGDAALAGSADHTALLPAAALPFVNESIQNATDACAHCRWLASCGGPTSEAVTAFGASWVKARLDDPSSGASNKATRSAPIRSATT